MWLWVSSIGIAAGCLIGFIIGLFLPRWAKPWRITLLGLSVFLLAGKFCLIHCPAFLIWLFPNPVYGWISTWWVLIPFSVLLGYAIHFLPRSRRSIYFGFSGFFYFLFLLDVAFRLTADYRRLNGRPDEHGLCLQTSEYSCGAAAAASFLSLLGYSTTEAEMARWMRPSRITGVNEHTLAWALNRFLATHHSPQRVELALVSDSFPQRLPLLVTRRLNFLVAHWLVLVRQKGTNVYILDPLEGAKWISLPDLEKVLRPICIRLRKRKPSVSSTNEVLQRFTSWRSSWEESCL